MNIVEELRIGTFVIHQSIIKSDPDLVIEICKDVLIIDTEVDFFTDERTYRGFSKWFDSIEVGSSIPPRYTVLIEQQENGVNVAKFVKET